MKGIRCNTCRKQCNKIDECTNEAEKFCYYCNYNYGSDECHNCTYYED